MERVMIIGSGGAGKSTLARELGLRTGLPVFHLDAVYWKPGWEPTSREEWELKIKEISCGAKWIIDGNYSGTMNIRLANADTIIFLDYSRWVNMYGIVKRRMMYRKKTRPDMNEGCKERLDWAFIKWVWSFEREKAPQLRKKLQNFPDKEVHHFRNRKELKLWQSGL